MDEAGFRQAMEEHRLASGAGEAFGALGGEDVDLLPRALARPSCSSRASSARTAWLTTLTSGWKCEGPLLALVKDGEPGRIR